MDRQDVMSPDEIVSEIFRLQEERNPDDDPGDITIDIQDDSALHAVFQRGTIIGVGDSIQACLEYALAAVRADIANEGLPTLP